MQTVAFQNDVLEGAGNDSCTPQNDNTTRSCLRFDLVSTSGGINLVQDIDLGQTGPHLFYPAVTFDSGGNLWIGSSVSSTTQLGTAGETFVAGGIFPTVVPRIDYAIGAGPYDCTFCTAGNGDTRNRWGHYSAAAQDPRPPRANERASANRHRSSARRGGVAGGGCVISACGCAPRRARRCPPPADEVCRRSLRRLPARGPVRAIAWTALTAVVMFALAAGKREPAPRSTTRCSAPRAG